MMGSGIAKGAGWPSPRWVFLQMSPGLFQSTLVSHCFWSHPLTPFYKLLSIVFFWNTALIFALPYSMITSASLASENKITNEKTNKETPKKSSRVVRWFFKGFLVCSPTYLSNLILPSTILSFLAFCLYSCQYLALPFFITSTHPSPYHLGLKSLGSFPIPFLEVLYLPLWSHNTSSFLLLGTCYLSSVFQLFVLSGSSAINILCLWTDSIFHCRLLISMCC